MPPGCRIDIAGYAERRRQALQIYAARLADQVTEEGGEIMLEPMNASDRKVIHDAISEVAGVRSYSEGEPPDRYVVISVDTETAEPEENGVVAEDVAPEERTPNSWSPPPSRQVSVFHVELEASCQAGRAATLRGNESLTTRWLLLRIALA